MRRRYWLKCFRLYRNTLILFISEDARDAAVARIIMQGYAVTTGCTTD